MFLDNTAIRSDLQEHDDDESISSRQITCLETIPHRVQLILNSNNKKLFCTQWGITERELDSWLKLPAEKLQSRIDNENLWEEVSYLQYELVSTTYGVNADNAKPPKSSKVELGPPPCYLNESQKRVWMLLSKLVKKDGCLPETGIVNSLQRRLRCGKSAVVPTVHLARRELRKKATKPHIIDSLINSLFCNKTESGCKYSQRNVNQLLQLIDCAHCVLWNKFPDETQLLTFTIPSVSETTYLATCATSDEIPLEIVKRLVPKEQEPLFIYRWEPQSKQSGTDGRLHLHILLKSRTKYSVATLRNIWFSVLDDFLDEKTLCSPFIGENGEDHRFTGAYVHGEPFNERPDQDKYPATYLALRRKHGSSTFPQRRLAICEGKQVSPVSHGGVSTALQRLVEAESVEVRIPARTLLERQYLETDLKKRVNALSAEITTSELYGKLKLRFPKSIHPNVIDLLKTFDQENTSASPKAIEKADHYLLLKLLPNRTLGIYPHSRIKR